MSGKPLSPRMEEVVRLAVGEEMPYKRIALELGIHERTVRNYACEIGRRLGRKPQKAMAWYFYNVLEQAA